MNTGEKIKRWIQPAVRAMSAYHVPDAEGLIKLDAMENPYCWPEDIKQGWLRLLAGAEINRYPDADARLLKERIAEVFSVPGTARVLLGNGSDEIIQILALAMAGPNHVILAPEPGFIMYRMVAGITGARFIGVPLDQESFALDAEAMLAAIRQHEPGLIFLAWPNNPTGNLFDEEAVIRIIEAAPGVVLLDEAYHVFAQKSFMPLLTRYENLLVMRTLSKLGLAGLRLGFLAGHPAWINEFEKLRMPYNVGVLTQRSVVYILEHIEVLDEQAEKIRQGRAYLYENLCRMDGITVWPSAANFLLIRVEQGAAGAVHQYLMRSGILVKNLDGSHPFLRNCLRVAVGTAADNDALLCSLSSALRQFN